MEKKIAGKEQRKERNGFLKKALLRKEKMGKEKRARKKSVPGWAACRS